AAGGVSNVPLGGAQGRTSFVVEGQSADASALATSGASLGTPRSLRPLRIELVRGRTFDDHDDGHPPGRIVVSETFARTFFPGVDAIGKRVSLGRGRPPGGAIPAQPQQRAPDSWLTIVGIVRDVKTARLDAPSPPVMYRSVLQVS